MRWLAFVLCLVLAAPQEAEMATVLNQTFTAGNSTFTATDVYDQGSEGVDPLYPFIEGAEAVTVNGSNRMDWSGTYSDYQGAGAWWKGFGPLSGGKFNANEGTITVTYHTNSTSIAEAGEAILAALPNYAGLGAPLYIAWNNAPDNTFKIEFETWSSFISATPAYTFVADQTYVLKVEWKCGTIVGDWDDVTADGYVKVYVNGTLVYDSGLLAFFLSQDFVDSYNASDGLFIGYFGLLGAVSSVVVTDAVAATTTAPSVIIPTSVPCCGDGGSGAAAGPIIPPISSDWTATCTGGGTVPTASDLTDSEDWSS